jgi:hypothetical protein
MSSSSSSHRAELRVVVEVLVVALVPLLVVVLVACFRRPLGDNPGAVGVAMIGQHAADPGFQRLGIAAVGIGEPLALEPEDIPALLELVVATAAVKRKCFPVVRDRCVLGPGIAVAHLVKETDGAHEVIALERRAGRAIERIRRVALEPGRGRQHGHLPGRLPGPAGRWSKVPPS